MCLKFITAIMVIVAIAGCSPQQDADLSTDQHEAVIDELRLQLRDLSKEKDRLTMDNRILSAKLEELVAREKLLVDKTNRLTFLNDQQIKQIEVLADAPAQRDAYKAKCQQLQEEIIHLKSQIKREPTSRGTVSTPTTAATKSLQQN